MLRCFLSLLCLSVSFATLSAHPFHGSIAEAEWNPKTEKLEVALWVHPMDLEKVLRQRAKKPIDLDKTKNVDTLILAYLKNVLQVKTGQGRVCPIQWVGKEIKIKDAWLYFEIPLAGGLEGIKIRHRVFLDLLPDQVNTITFRQKKARKSISFTRERPEQVFTWKAAKK